MRITAGSFFLSDIEMSSKLLKKSCRLALVQLKVGSNKQLNLANAARLVASAASTDFKANIVVLPECFNSPYGTGFFNDYAEDNLVSGETAIALKEMAKSNGIYLVGGSFPERQGSLLFNTCTVWNPKGDMIGVHRKLHLFDICVKDKITFKESDVLTAGKSLGNSSI